MDQTDAQVILTDAQITGTNTTEYRRNDEPEILERQKVDKNVRRNEYPIQSSPSGYAMIIDNGDFNPESGFPPRKGSEKDVKNLAELFEFLGFKVFSKQNLRKKEIFKSIEEFKLLFKNADVDMCVFCIMSHGSNGNIVDINGNEIDVEEEIIKKFYNKECPALQGKPKLFLLQYCRGDEMDYGTEEFRNTVRSSANLLGAAPGAPKIPNVTDILIANSTVPGYVSNRNIHHGTWFFQCLVGVFRENADHMDIRDMFDEVAVMLNQKESKDAGRRKQTFEVINRGFFKKLYFNPIKNNPKDFADVIDGNINDEDEQKGKKEGFKRNLREPWSISFD